MDYKDKIRKLLALAESPSEAEAKAALLKARELMAKHKLTQADLDEATGREVRSVVTEISFSKRREPWIYEVAPVIAENNCCAVICRHYRREHNRYVGFIGLEDDIGLCVEMFFYAVDCVRAVNKETKKTYKGYPTYFIKEVCDSYGLGFASGLKDAFERQKEEHQEWGLVMVIPKEVTDIRDGLKTLKFRSSAEDRILDSEFERGKTDGANFRMDRRLKEAT